MAEQISTVKEEPVDVGELQKRIIELCEKNTVGITNELLLAAIPGVNKTSTVAALNILISQGKLEILRKGKQMLYKVKDREAAKKCMGATNEEKVIYQMIENSGNKGIGNKDLKFKTNLKLIQVNKILKILESKKLIKNVMSVCNSTRKKVFMLYDAEPDNSVTGGPWFGDEGFDEEFVIALNRQCHSYLCEVKAQAENRGGDPIAQKNASYKSSKEIWKYIIESKISKIDITLGDVDTLMGTLYYDNKVEKKVVVANPTGSCSKETTNLYRAVDLMLPNSGVARMPCGTCMVYDNCYENGAISPSTCPYMKEWLEF